MRIDPTFNPFLLTKKRGWQDMVAYEFYWFDKTEKAHFLGIFHERRTNPLRVTRESVLNLGRAVIGDHAGATGIYFIQVEV
jgi:hypothetical protein